MSVKNRAKDRDPNGRISRKYTAKESVPQRNSQLVDEVVYESTETTRKSAALQNGSKWRGRR